MEHFKAKVTDKFSVVLYDLLNKVQDLAKMQQTDINSTVATVLRAVDGSLRNIDSKLSRLEPSS